MISRIAWSILVFVSCTALAGTVPYSPSLAVSPESSSGGIDGSAHFAETGGDATLALVRSMPGPEFSLIENRGQWPVHSDAGRLLAVTSRHRGARLFFFERGISIVHYLREGASDASPGVLPLLKHEHPTAKPRLRAYRVDLRFQGAGTPDVVLAGAADGMRRYYQPAIPDGVGAVPAWRRIEYRNLYPGVDFSCALKDGGLKYAFTLQPGTDPSVIRMQYIGAHPRRDEGRGIMLRHAAGEISDDAPFVYQQTGDGAQQARDAWWTLEHGILGFHVATWDRDRPLIIDPFLQWSTFLGGTLSDYARDVALGEDGSMYLCGYTAGADFPVTPGAMQSASRGNFEVFISAFSRERKLLWSTYYGGSGSEENPQIAISGDGELFVAGSTSSTDLPVSVDAMQPRSGGRYDVFLLALDKTGARRWATYFGGSYTDECGDITVAKSGSICIAGGTYSTNFPVTPDALQTSNAGDYDMFAARFSSDGTRQWASYIGGWSMDYASGIAVDDGGDLYLAGRTESTNLPGVDQGRQSSYGGGSFDAFVLRISAKQRSILWATYLGGEKEDGAERIAIGADGAVIVTGYTASERFPLAGSNRLSRLGGLIDGFLSSLDANGQLQWSSYLGGTEVDKITGLSVDIFGNIMVSGFTGSANFPLTGTGFQKEKAGGYDLFLSQFADDGTYLWATLFGGETHDISYGLGTDARGNAIIVGGTESRGFRTAGNIQQGDLAGLTDAFVLRIIFNEPIANAGSDTIICAGGEALLSGRASGGQPPYLYSWEPSQALSNARDARPRAMPGATTDYVLTVTDAEGAVARDTVTVSVSRLPVADAGDDRAICPGATATLDCSVRGGRGPYTFRWTPAEGLSNPEAAAPDANPAASTVYTVTVTDALGCTARDSVRVTVHPGVIVETGGELKACADAPVTLNAAVRGGAAPFRWQWKPASGLNDPALQSPVLMPSASASYVVTVTDANGCSARDTLIVTVHQPPKVDAGENLALCAGQGGRLNARVSGGKKPYRHAWSPRAGLSSVTALTPDAKPDQTTRYVLTVTDANGCVVRDSVLVAVHPQPSLQLAGEVDVCRGARVQIGAQATGGTPPFRYRWSPAAGLSDPSASMPMASPSRSTTYTLSVTDANGCSTGGTVRVSVRPRPGITLRGSHRICSGATTDLKASVSGGTPPYTYAWSPAIGLSATDIAAPVAAPVTSTTYTLQVTDAAGCVVEEQVTVDVLAPPIVEAGADVTLCEGGDATLDARVNGGKPPYRISWRPSLGLSSTSRLDPTVRTTTSRTYRVTVTDANGCSVSDSVRVVIAPPPVVNAGADIDLCSGASTPLEATVSGGTPPYRYSWSPATGLFNKLTATPTARPERTTTYTLTVTDERGCTVTDEVTVTVHPSPQIIAAPEITICRDQARRLDVDVRGGRKPYTYQWMPLEGLSAGNIATPVANPVQTTTYTLHVTDANGCVSTTTITVTVLPCNKADAGEDAEMCSGDERRLGSARVDTMYGARYRWTPAVGLSSSTAAQPIARPREDTRYVLHKRNRYDCVTTDTVFLRVYPMPQLDAGEEVTLCPGESETLTATVSSGTAPYRFAWTPAAGLDRTDARSVEARPAVTTRYRLTVTDANGCAVSDSVTVHVPDPLRMNMDRTVAICQGGRVRIGGSASGGTPPYTYFWSPAKGLSDRESPDPEASPAASTRYALTLSDAAGCSITDTVHCTVHQAPVADITAGGETRFCEGEHVRLSAPEGYTDYRWSNGARGRTVTADEKGSYTVTVTNTHGCSSTSEPVEVHVMPLPDARIVARGPTSFCEGDSVTLDAGEGFATYAWSTGATSRRITVREEGSYVVEVTGAQGCLSRTKPVTVTVRPTPVAAMLRRRDTLIAYPAEQYQWLHNGVPIPGATDRMFIARRSGAYALQTRNDAQCIAESDPVTLDIGRAALALPNVTAQRGDTIAIALRLLSAAEMDAAGSGKLEADVAVKKKTLRVISGGTVLSDTQDVQRIRMSGRYRKGETSIGVLRAEILAERGNYPIVLESVHWLDGLVRTERRDGSLIVRD